MSIQHSAHDWVEVGIHPELAFQLARLVLPEHLHDKSDFEISFFRKLRKEGLHILLAHDGFDQPIVMAADGTLWHRADDELAFLQSGLEKFFQCEAAYDDFLSKPPLSAEWSEERDAQEGELLHNIISAIDPRAAEESVLWAIRIEEFTDGVLTRD